MVEHRRSQSVVAVGKQGAPWRVLPLVTAVAWVLAEMSSAHAQQSGKAPTPTAASTPSAAPSLNAAEAEKSKLEPVVVTGSRIRRENSSAPVTQVDSEFIKELGLSSVGDVLQTQATFGVGQGSQTVNHSNVDAGSSFADLRGLGTRRTLVLFDGRRRVAGSAVSGAVDLSTLAPSLIDTVDVVTGGASAIYGADAVSGVVNFRLKRNLQGVVSGARLGITQEGGGNESEAYLGGGTSFAGGRGSFSAIVGYNKQGQLSSMDRDFTVTPRRLFPNPADTGIGDGQPAQIVLNDFRFANFDRGGSICLRNADGTFTRFAAVPGGIQPFQGQIVGTSGCSTYVLGGNGSNPAKQLNLRSGLEALSMVTQTSLDLTPDLKAYVNFDAASTRTVVIGEEIADSQTQLIIRRDNPFISADLAQQLDSRGLTQFGLGRSHFDLGRRAQKRDRDTYTIETGLKGSFGTGWTWEGFAQHGEFKAKTRLENDRINANFFRAVDVVLDPVTGQPRCRDTTAVGCVPLNVLGEGVASPEALAYVRYTTRQQLVSRQTVAGGSASGDVLDLPAGKAKLVAGAEFRKESLDIDVDPLSRQRALFQGLGIANLNAEFDVTEGFVETVVPVLRNLPMVRSLALEGAVRVSDYSTIGRTTTSRIGGAWEISTPLSLRVQRSSSVRAPSLFELFGPETVARANVIDPCSGALRNSNPNRAANCTALGLAPGYTDPRSAESENIISGGNPTLKPEKSDSWTFGVAGKGSLFGQRFSASVDYWSIDISDAIQGLNVERIINGCVDASSIGNALCPLVTRDPSSGGITDVRNVEVNLASLKARGIDYQFRLSFDEMPSLTGSGDARGSIALAGTYLMDREELGNANDPATLTLLAGEIGFPKHRMNLQLRYKDGPIAVSWSSRFIGTVKLDVQLPREFYPDGVNDVKSRVYHDLSVQYSVKDSLRVQFGIRNVFNLAPPNTPQHLFGNSAYAGIGTGGLYDNVGRTYIIGLDMKL